MKASLSSVSANDGAGWTPTTPRSRNSRSSRYAKLSRSCSDTRTSGIVTSPTTDRPHLETSPAAYLAYSAMTAAGDILGVPPAMTPKAPERRTRNSGSGSTRSRSSGLSSIALPSITPSMTPSPLPFSAAAAAAATADAISLASPIPLIPPLSVTGRRGKSRASLWTKSGRSGGTDRFFNGDSPERTALLAWTTIPPPSNPPPSDILATNSARNP
mmetsp:Transcript_2935/g.7672  ORF Transcript_2935/g.7672 Transcript_2935/m.7672 type:complete len:215 (+) Transcript_2935:570-1214(+)